jgi:hypothetical protein
VVRLAKAYVSLHPVDKAYEDSTEEVHEQYTQRVAPKGGRTWRSKFWPHEVDTRQGETEIMDTWPVDQGEGPRVIVIKEKPGKGAPVGRHRSLRPRDLAPQ